MSDVRERAVVKGKIRIVAATVGATGLARRIVLVQSPMVVLVPREPMLPARGSRNHHLRACEKVIFPRSLLGIGQEQTLPVKVPFRRNSGAAIRMPRPQPELHALVQLHSNVAALQCIGVIRVRPLPISLELVGKGVVVEARPRS